MQNNFSFTYANFLTIKTRLHGLCAEAEARPLRIDKCTLLCKKEKKIDQSNKHSSKTPIIIAILMFPNIFINS